MKTQDQIKTDLLKLKKDVKPFEVVFSGKRSKKVYGLYKPDEALIIIHNGNFTTDEKMMYTAIHEFAHHIHFTAFDGFVKGAHNAVFKNIMHGLLDIAEEKGLYSPGWKDFVIEKTGNEQITKIKKEVEKSNTEIVRIYKTLSKKLISMCSLAEQHHFDFDDYLDRGIGLKRLFVNTIAKGLHNGVEETIGFEHFLYCSKIKNDDTRQLAIDLFLEGKTKEQIESTLKPEKFDIEDIDIQLLLIDEKEKTENKVNKGIRKIEYIEEKLKEREI